MYSVCMYAKQGRQWEERGGGQGACKSTTISGTLKESISYDDEMGGLRVLWAVWRDDV